MEAICLASGPSMTAADAALARTWRDAVPGRFAIAVNSTFRLAPWVDHVFGMDDRWWLLHGKEVSATAPKAVRWRWTHHAKNQFAQPAQKLPGYEPYGNSGAGAIALAAASGAKVIYLLGYDAQKTAGRSHWHGDHPKGLGNAGSVARWPLQFGRCAKAMQTRGIRVINLTRQTALTCFPKENADHALRMQRETGEAQGAISGAQAA